MVQVKSTDHDAMASFLPFLRFFLSVMGPQITYIPAARAAAIPPITPQFFMTLYLKKKNKFTIFHDHTHSMYIERYKYIEITFHQNNPLACQIPTFQVKAVCSNIHRIMS